VPGVFDVLTSVAWPAVSIRGKTGELGRATTSDRRNVESRRINAESGLWWDGRSIKIFAHNLEAESNGMHASWIRTFSPG